MRGDSRYLIPAGLHRRELEVERSRFTCTLANAASAAEVQRVVREVSAEMTDATHHCWAFVAGPPGSTNQIGLSDDGEPHGTAGRPMLTVLMHSDVGEAVAIVTRYNGGVKLGTGGLARAYSGTVQLAQSTMPRAESLRAAVLHATRGCAQITLGEPGAL